MTLVVSECVDLTNNLSIFIQYACCLEKVSYSISNVYVSSTNHATWSVVSYYTCSIDILQLYMYMIDKITSFKLFDTLLKYFYTIISTRASEVVVGSSVSAFLY